MRRLAAAGTVLLWASAFPAITVAVRGFGPAGLAVARLAVASAALAAVFRGLAPSAAGFVLWAYAMARMDVGRVTVSLYLVPAAAIGIALDCKLEIAGPAQLIGG